MFCKFRFIFHLNQLSVKGLNNNHFQEYKSFSSKVLSVSAE